MFNKRVLDIFSIITGIFFVVSGIGKVVNTTAFSNLIHQYGFDYLMIISPIIVLAEILIGLCLLLLINTRRISFYALLLLVIFTIAFAYAHFKHGVNDCGCMGAILPTKMPPVLSFLRNLVLILMTLFVWLKYPGDKANIAKWKKIFLLASMCIAIFFAGNTFSFPSILKRNANKPKFENKIVKTTELANFIKTSTDKSYLVFCFSYSCPHCWNSIENLRQFIRMKIADSVIVFGMGNIADKEFFIRNFKPDFKFNDISHDNMVKLTTFYPTAFYIRHDSIKAVLQGVLPSAITFRKFYLEPDFK
jgi:uncharacterized membrane protein YphA (DoxX/SURF4 family)